MTDEKDQNGADESKKKKVKPSKGKPVSKAKDPVAAEEANVSEQKISLLLALGLIIGSLVIGLGVGYAVAPKGTSIDYGGTQDPGASAPSLTPEQLNSEQLPPSHPTIPSAEDSSGSESTAAPSDEDPEAATDADQDASDESASDNDSE